MKRLTRKRIQLECLASDLSVSLQLMRALPNIITFSRIVVLALMVWLVYQPWFGAATLAFFCILYGAISDFLDGYLARKYQLITNFGKIMDALVDKVMVLGSFILLIVVGLMGPAWLMSILVFLIAAREIGITVIRMIAARKGIVLAAETMGKRKTIWQITAVCVFFAVPMFERDLAEVLRADLSLFAFYVWVNAMLYFALSTFLTLWSGAFYLKRYAFVFRTDSRGAAA